MADRGLLDPMTALEQMKTARSNSFNPPPSQSCHLKARSRRTFSLPCREKPCIPPAIAEKNTSHFADAYDNSELGTRSVRTKNIDEFEWYVPIVGLGISLLLLLWACLLSLSSNNS